MESPANRSDKRPYLGILFECCGVYDRIYRKNEATYYMGRCPRCFRQLKIKVDPREGSKSRFWKAL